MNAFSFIVRVGLPAARELTSSLGLIAVRALLFQKGPLWCNKGLWTRNKSPVANSKKEWGFHLFVGASFTCRRAET